MISCMALNCHSFWIKIDWLPQATKLANNATEAVGAISPPTTTWHFLISIPVCAIVGGLVAFGSSYFEWASAAQAITLGVFNLVFLGLLGLVVSQVVINYASYTQTKSICEAPSPSLSSDCKKLSIFWKISVTGAAALVFSELSLLILSWMRSSQILKKRHADLPLNKIVADAFQNRPARNVLLLGRNGAGKTHTLYRLKWSDEVVTGELKYERKPIQSSSLSPDPTEAVAPDGSEMETKTKSFQMGFNNEIVKFHHMSDNRGQIRRIYEFWDVGGAHPFMWRSFYVRILFDMVVYTIDANQYHYRTKSIDDEETKDEGDLEGDDDKDSPFVEDRMELLSLLNDPHLQLAYFIVFLNFKKDDDLLPGDHIVVNSIKDFLDLHEYTDNPTRILTHREMNSYCSPRRRLIWVDNFTSLKAELVRLYERTKAPPT